MASMGLTALQRETNPNSYEGLDRPTIDVPNLDPYFKQYVRNGNLRPDIRTFYLQNYRADSRVWVVFIDDKPDSRVSSKNFENERELAEFFDVSKDEKGGTRIFTMEGIAPWSVALVGRALEMPIEFFMETVSAGHVINSEVDRGTVKTCNIDNFKLEPTATGKRKFLPFTALGRRGVGISRSHIYMKTRIDPYEESSLSDRSSVLETDASYHAQAVVVFNDCVAYGNALANLYKSPRKRDRIRNCIGWLVWDMYHLMNDWPSILEGAMAQLKLRESNVRDSPDLSLTRMLHRDSAILTQLSESLRVQHSIYAAKYGGRRSYIDDSLRGSMKDLETRLLSYRTVIGVLSEQTKNLTDLLFNTISVNENVSIGRLTWVTIIFLPLGFAASIFSMGIRELGESKPAAWVYVVCALSFLTITIAVIYGLRHLPRWWKKRARKDYGEIGLLEEDIGDDNDVGYSTDMEDDPDHPTDSEDHTEDGLMGQQSVQLGQRPSVERPRMEMGRPSREMLDKLLRAPQSSRCPIYVCRENVICSNDLALYRHQRELHRVMVVDPAPFLKSTNKERGKEEDLRSRQSRARTKLSTIPEGGLAQGNLTYGESDGQAGVSQSSSWSGGPSLPNAVDSLEPKIFQMCISLNNGYMPRDDEFVGYFVPAGAIKTWEKFLSVLKYLAANGSRLVHPGDISTHIWLGYYEICINNLRLADIKSWDHALENELCALLHCQPADHLSIQVITATGRGHEEPHYMRSRSTRYIPLPPGISTTEADKSFPPLNLSVTVPRLFSPGSFEFVVPSKTVESYSDFLNFLRRSRIQDKVVADFDVLCDGQVIIPDFWPLVIKYESVRQWKRSSPRLDIRVRFTGARYARRIHTPRPDQPPPAPYPESIQRGSVPGLVSLLPKPLVKRSRSTPVLRSRSRQDLLSEWIGSLKTDPRKLEPAPFSEVEEPKGEKGPHPGPRPQKHREERHTMPHSHAVRAYGAMTG